MFRVLGPDVAGVRAWTEQAKAILQANPNMRGVNDNWNERVKVLRLNVDQDKARALGVTSQNIAVAARTVLSGSTVGQYREGDKLIDIVLRQPADERNAITDLATAYLPTASGRAIPLSQIASFEFAWEPGVIWREGRKFAATVQGDVVEGVQGPTVTFQVWPELQKLKAKMPPDYDIQIAGAVAESSKGQDSIAVGVPVMLFIMFTLLVLQLQSVSRAFLVVLTAPMGIAGVAGALLLLNRPFGFVALLGFIALAGMIMRNSVILIDQIEQDRKKGVPAWNCDRRIRRAPLPADRPDGGCRGAGDDPAVAQRVLGADGGGDHGRAGRGDGVDAARAAGAVCGLVPRQEAGRSHKLNSRAQRHQTARVAKLVDAPGLGPDALTGVGVRVPPRAPRFLCRILQEHCHDGPS